MSCRLRTGTRLPPRFGQGPQALVWHALQFELRTVLPPRAPVQRLRFQRVAYRQIPDGLS